MFSLFRKACSLYKTSKMVFSPFIFAIYGMGIQGVTRSDWGLQGVTGGYKGLQGVKRGDRGLQRIIQTLMVVSHNFSYMQVCPKNLELIIIWPFQTNKQNCTMYVNSLFDVMLSKSVKSSVLLWFRIPQRPSKEGSTIKIQVEIVNLKRQTKHSETYRMAF